MTTGQLIQQARKSAGLSQKQLGEKLGLSASMIGQWENDLRNPKLETIQRIAAVLKVSVGYLLYGHTLRAMIKEWKSDKAARLYMRIDSTLLDDLEGIAKLDNVPLDDMIEEILYWDVEKRIEDRMSEDDARAMQEWYDSRTQPAPTAPAEPEAGQDTTPALEGAEGPYNQAEPIVQKEGGEEG